MPVKTILMTPALDDEFHSHLRLVEPSDADFIFGLRTDPDLGQHYAIG